MNTKGKFGRLFWQPTSTVTPNDNTNSTRIESPKLRPSVSQSAVFSLGKETFCLDRSPDGLRAVTAGPSAFKIVKIDGTTITEEIDLRSLMWTFVTTHNPSANPKEFNARHNIVAVKWSHGVFDTIIIAACSNGTIAVYDLTRAREGFEVGRIQAHDREIYALAINPHYPQWLLSASRDSTVKSWAIRSPTDDPTIYAYIRQRHLFKCPSDVLDVQWSPIDGFGFACCTDFGQILKWDLREPTKVSLRINAHAGQCCSISWHPDGQHLASGGQDQFCHVWSLSREKNQKPVYTLETRSPISNVSWRPAFWSATANGKRAAQIAVSYQDSRHLNAIVEIWDLARPGMPFKQLPFKQSPPRKLGKALMTEQSLELKDRLDSTEAKRLISEGWETAPTAILWNSRDILWTVNNTIGVRRIDNADGTVTAEAVEKQGWFIQSDVAFIPNLIDHRSLSHLALSASGEIMMVMERRQALRRPKSFMNSPQVSSFSYNNGDQILSRSQSDSEEDVVSGFLGPSQKKGARSWRKNSGRSSQLSTMPPTNNGVIEKAMDLEASIKVTGIYKPQQVLAAGHAPSATKLSEYKYYSNRYLTRLKICKTVEKPPDARIASITEYYAKTAEGAGHYRMAQTWRLLGFTMGLLLTRRAEYHRELRLTAQEPRTSEEIPLSGADRSDEIPRNTTRRQMKHSDLKSVNCNAQANTQKEIKNTPNFGTHLARSSAGPILYETREQIYCPVTEDEELKLLQPARPGLPSPIFVPLAKPSPPQSPSSLKGCDFYRAMPFNPAANYTLPKRKQLLGLEYNENLAPRTQAQHHDSGESSQMFSTSRNSINSKASDSHDDQSRQLRRRASSWGKGPILNSSSTLSLDSDPLLHDRPSNHSEEPYNPSPNLLLQKASAPAVNDVDSRDCPDMSTHLSPHPLSGTNPSFIPSDFLPLITDPSFIIPALNPAKLLTRTISYLLTTTSTFIHTIPMILLLLPYLPANTIDRIHVSHILGHYHTRLMSLSLFTEAALLRNLCVPMYPEIFSSSQREVRVAFFCMACNKPLDPDPFIKDSQWKCTHCLKQRNPCPICLQHDFVPEKQGNNRDTKQLSTWWYCPGCAHGGHAACLEEWHSPTIYGGQQGTAYSEGACPVEGCLHPCLPGAWRDQIRREKEIRDANKLAAGVKEGLGLGHGGRVRRDTKDTLQSQAVEGVRIALSRLDRG